MQALDLEAKTSKFQFLKRDRECLTHTPVFLYHGESDDILPIKNTFLTYEIFQNKIFSKENEYCCPENLTIHTEGKMGHSVSDTELKLLTEWF